MAQNAAERGSAPPMRLSSRMGLELLARRAISGRSRVGLAHVGAALGMPVIVGPRIVVDARGGVTPQNGVGGAGGGGRQFGRVFGPNATKAVQPSRIPVLRSKSGK